MRQTAALLLCASAMVGTVLATTGDGDGALDNCKTNAWAKIPGGGNCFREVPELDVTRWGWNNQILKVDGETTLELWASANKCNTDKGWDAGSVKVVVLGDQVTITYIPSAGTTLAQYQLYVGADEWSSKQNGDPHVNPKKFPYKGTLDANHPIVVDVHETCPYFYVQAHAKACKEVTPCPPGATPSPSVATNPPVAFTFPPQITLPPRKSETDFTTPPSNGPACPIAMNGSAECECHEFSCDSPSSPWTDKDYRFCGQCPSYLNGAYHFSCPHCASSGTEVSFACPNNWESCDVFVQVYSNCATGNTDGGLAYNLRSEGWTPGSCGPSFCLSFNDTCQSPPTNAVQQFQDTNIQWKMVLFHKQFAGGDEIAIPALATEPTMYFTFFVKEGHFCTNDKNDQASCEETPSVCKWNAGTNECVADICPPVVPPPGARPCCDVAPGVEGADCAAGNTDITSVCDFNLPQCSPK